MGGAGGWRWLCGAGALPREAHPTSCGVARGPRCQKRASAFRPILGQERHEWQPLTLPPPDLVPGAGNHVSALVLRRLMPGATAIRLMGRVRRGMYGDG